MESGLRGEIGRQCPASIRRINVVGRKRRASLASAPARQIADFTPELLPIATESDAEKG
jgi:hypothetical protein